MEITYTIKSEEKEKYHTTWIMNKLIISCTVSLLISANKQIFINLSVLPTGKKCIILIAHNSPNYQQKNKSNFLFQDL